MAWTLAGVTIYVDDDDDDGAEPLYGQIQVLEATTTTLHYAGAKSRVRRLRFWIETEGSLNTLRSATEADANVALVSDLGAEGNYRIMKLTSRRRHAVNQANPWWECNAELMKR
jgi:hypothetical protein